MTCPGCTRTSARLLRRRAGRGSPRRGSRGSVLAYFFRAAKRRSVERGEPLGHVDADVIEVVVVEPWSGIVTAQKSRAFRLLLRALDGALGAINAAGWRGPSRARAEARRRRDRARSTVSGMSCSLWTEEDRADRPRARRPRLPGRPGRRARGQPSPCRPPARPPAPLHGRPRDSGNPTQATGDVHSPIAFSRWSRGAITRIGDN